MKLNMSEIEAKYKLFPIRHEKITIEQFRKYAIKCDIDQSDFQPPTQCEFDTDLD